MSRGKPFGFIYFVATALCVNHAMAKPISFTEVRIPARQSLVRLDLYQPNDQEPHRTILLLYGAGGLAFDGSRMRVTAQRLVSAGNIVYLLHYLDETGAFVAGPWSVRKDFDEWVETVRDAIAWSYGLLSEPEQILLGLADGDPHHLQHSLNKRAGKRAGTVAPEMMA
jgi:hypothetical protein